MGGTRKSVQTEVDNTKKRAKVQQHGNGVFSFNDVDASSCASSVVVG